MEASELMYSFVKDDEVVRFFIREGAGVRFYSFGEAPADVARPYAVFQMAGGLPANKLAGTPDEDTFSFQIDAYADKAVDARGLGIALRDALEEHGYVVSYNFEGREPVTRLYRYSFNFDLMTSRNVES